jgi:hypothetical protein
VTGTEVGTFQPGMQAYVVSNLTDWSSVPWGERHEHNQQCPTHGDPRRASPSPSVSTAAPAASTSGYPQQVADQALCTSYENLVQSGDTEGIASAVAGAGSTVTQSLATDMLRAASGTTLQQDDQNQVYVAMDCGIVSAGRQPIELRQ